MLRGSPTKVLHLWYLESIPEKSLLTNKERVFQELPTLSFDIESRARDD
jgi:hypothetical protein